MARRRAVNVADLFGFDPVGHGYHTGPDESRALLGHGPLALAVYHVLKRFARSNGKVIAASWYRIGEVLAHQATGPGRRLVDPTTKELRGAVDRLQAAGLVHRRTVDNRREGVLEIWLTVGVGGTLTPRIGAGYRAGSDTKETRASA